MSARTGPVAPRIAGPVVAFLDRYLDHQRERHDALDDGLAPLLAPIERLIHAGGKRVRPTFVLLGHLAAAPAADAGTPPPDAIVRLAAATELLHTFALLQDDVMDRSARRRGRPTAHETFAAEHRARGRPGDARRFGASAAILAGDLALTLADHLVASLPLPRARQEAVLDTYTDLRVEVIAGQYLDLEASGDREPQEATALRTALLKSGRYTVTRPLLLGAAAADGAGPRLRQALAAYGDALGTAFQLHDDLLGTFGDSRHTGASTEDDLRAGTSTVLVAHALATARPPLADELAARLEAVRSGRPVPTEDLDVLRELIAATGARDHVERLCVEHLDRALEALEAIPQPARDELRALAGALSGRSR